MIFFCILESIAINSERVILSKMTDTENISNIFFTKYNKQGELDDGNLIIENLYGNTIGSGNSEVPYIYCLSKDELTSKSKRNMFHLQVEFCWPRGSTIFDETLHNKKETYEEYSRRGYIGVVRLFDKSKRYVFFDVKDFIIRIKDTMTNQTLYEKLNDYDDKIYEDRLKLNESEIVQNSIDTLLISKIGSDYIDVKRDYFNISEICRRRQLPIYVIKEKLEKIINRITVNKTSGCWVSTSTKDYKRCFWLSLGGLRFNDIFHFPQDIAPDSEPIIIKNKAILHSPLCEQVLRREHFYCCRPQHLKLGTSKENATHIKIRKSLDQIFDLTPSDMRKYAYHIYCLADLIQKQIFTMTRDEYDIVKKRRGNKIFYVNDEVENEKFTEVIGDPDMGEVVEEIDDDLDGDLLWKVLQKSNNLLDTYTKKLKDANQEEN